MDAESVLCETNNTVSLQSVGRKINRDFNFRSKLSIIL